MYEYTRTRPHVLHVPATNHCRRGLLERMPQSSRPRAGASGAPAAQNGSAAGADADAERADLLGNTASIFSLGENLSALAVGFGAGAGDLPDLLASDSGTSISSAPSGASNQVRCSYEYHILV